MYQNVAPKECSYRYDMPKNVGTNKMCQNVPPKKCLYRYDAAECCTKKMFVEIKCARMLHQKNVRTDTMCQNVAPKKCSFRYDVPKKGWTRSEVRESKQRTFNIPYLENYSTLTKATVLTSSEYM